MHTRTIPSSGEPIGVVGVGTYRGFDVSPQSGPGLQRLGGVLDALFAAGGRVVDSSPMYDRAEAVVGRLLARRPAAETATPPFLATKVWTHGRDAGIAQMRESMRLFGVETIDLMQVHNLVDWRVHLKTLRAWKDEGRLRYIGVTHYTPSAHAELEAVLRAEPLDFLQVDYSIGDRAAEERLLPLAAERGVAVLANLPLGSGSLLRSVSRAALPPVAAELGCGTWSELLLKWVVGHPAIACAIPGTGNPAHMAENARAGEEPLPDDAQRARIVEAWSAARR